MNKVKFSFLIILTLGLLVSCKGGAPNRENNGNQNSSQYSEPPRQKTPEELRQELLEQERENPKEYLKHEGTWRGNFIGQTVLEGTISNSATIANFKDVILAVTWVSKTGTDIKTEYYTVYEFVPAGKSTEYKIKTNAPSETSSIKVGVNSATSVN